MNCRSARPQIKFPFTLFADYLFVIGLTVFVVSETARAVESINQKITLKTAEALVRNRKTKFKQFDLERIRQQLQIIQSTLSQQQSQEVGAYLRHLLGNGLNPGDPYQRGRERSRENLLRLIKGQSSFQFTPEYDLAWEVIGRGLRSFEHNTIEIPASSEDVPLWLSSEQIEKMGIHAGLQSHLPFNRDFLKTQNWIFFFVGEDGDRVYGDNKISVGREYAAQKGFIFPFVMDVGELAAAGVYMDEAAGNRFLQLFETTYPKTKLDHDEALHNSKVKTPEPFRVFNLAEGTWRDGVSTYEFFDRHREIFESFRRALANFMFTVEDYQEFVATKVAAHLVQLYKVDQAAYKRAVAILSDSSGAPEAKYATNVLVRSILREARLPEKFEMRIPVAIPGESIVIGLPYCKMIFNLK